jgi:hypothetical protein
MLPLLLFIFSFSYITWLLMDIPVLYTMKLVGDGFNNNFRRIGTSSQDVVIANLLGYGGVQVTVSSRMDPFPPWDCHN